MEPYSVSADPARGFLHIVMRGYWDQAIFDQFAHHYEDALARFAATGGIDRALVDGRDFAVQDKHISEQFGALIARNKDRLARRTATVVPAHLDKLQAERAGGDLAARYFIGMDEAQAWLFAPLDAAPPVTLRARAAG